MGKAYHLTKKRADRKNVWLARRRHTGFKSGSGRGANDSTADLRQDL